MAYEKGCGPQQARSAGQGRFALRALLGAAASPTWNVSPFSSSANGLFRAVAVSTHDHQKEHAKSPQALET
eukprot:7328758-Alexandrium_andersonii.AAC.1